MTISADLFRAILAMDAYNRGYNAGVNVAGPQIGNAVLSANSQILGTGVDVAASFFAQAYTLANGQTVISYRGTDVVPFVTDPFYSPSSWADVAAWSIWAGGNYQTAQAKRVRWVELLRNPSRQTE
jgi:hypothetical protein